ncbi:helix-turn-helix domain-containing protein [Variovorax sp. RCC_210]|uniref:helix-turn-helix domain-containing protein n=1 Tax=Variovorax sp. RCC_210 TaxID=3239217 RepID=UPI0035269D71
MSKTVEIIKRLRSRGLSQSEISRRTGVAQTRLSRWEGGAVAAAADDVLKLQDLAQALDATDRAAVQGEGG